MPKTRLLQSDRDAIQAAVIAHKFDPIEAALFAEENALAEQVRRFVSGPYLTTMDKAPAGAFEESTDIDVNAGGYRVPLFFGGKYPNQTRRRLMHKHTGYSGRVDLDSESEIGSRVRAWAERRETTKKDKNKLSSTTAATLAQFRSFDDLLAAWPEAERYINSRWRARPDFIANVPVVALKELAANLDLPPEEQEAA